MGADFRKIKAVALAVKRGKRTFVGAGLSTEMAQVAKVDRGNFVERRGKETGSA